MLSIICVGKLKEKSMRQSCDEYLKRLSRYTKINEIELPDLPEPQNASDKDRQAVMDEEGRRILERIGQRDYVFALCVEGDMPDSPSFSKNLDNLKSRGEANLVFVIGGSLGLSPAVKARANEKISLSRLTFPHNLARLMLLEQLYRCHKISAGEKYHK